MILRGVSGFMLRAKAKLATQCRLYCLTHNIEKSAHRAAWPK